jgi:hypothetical protein
LSARAAAVIMPSSACSLSMRDPMTRITSTVKRAARAAWHELVDAADWTTNPNIDRPRIGERGDVLNPSGGWSRPNPRVNEGRELERKGEQEG